MTEEENAKTLEMLKLRFLTICHLLSDDEDVIIPPDWIVCVVNPLESVVNLYKEKIDGQVD